MHTRPTRPTPMHFDATAILQQLDAVQRERQRRLVTPDLEARVRAVKRFQQQRFEFTYTDLLASTRYRGAARFFLHELYGPQDFSQRDAQLARVIPALVRLFPAQVVDVVGIVVSLHALSEQLDSAMGQQHQGQGGALDAPPYVAQRQGGALDAASYVAAWRLAGAPAQRERQIALTIDVGASLDRIVSKPLLRQSLRLMRGPARAAGLGDLQDFLERGFDAFRAMGGAGEFLALVAQRERQLAAALFGAAEAASLRVALGLLPAITQP